jgi:hypothetical protein
MAVINLGSSSAINAATCTPTTVSVTSTSSSAAASNISRKKILLFAPTTNTANVLISFAATATSPTAIPLAPGQGWYEETPPIYTGAISAITASGTASLQVFEWS